MLLWRASLFALAFLTVSLVTPHAVVARENVAPTIRPVDQSIVSSLRKGDFARASLIANAALHRDPGRANLHILNGIAYEGLAIGDPGQAILAEQGFRLAIKFEPSSWLGHYLLGRHLLARKKWGEAKAALAEALLLDPDQPDTLYSLAVAAYHNQESDIALGLVERLATVEGATPRVLRLGAFAAASAGDEAQAYLYSEKLSAMLGAAEKAKLDARLGDWSSFYRRHREAAQPVSQPAEYTDDGGYRVTLTQYGPDPQYPGAPAYRSPPPRTDDPEETAPLSERMVVVDVVIIGTEENTATSAGINLLNNLSVQFGDLGRPAAQFSYQRDSSGGLPTSSSQVVSAAISVPAINYSLNIANAAFDRSEVLARPSLVGIDGKQSSFFSGLQVQAAAAAGSALGGSPIFFEKDVGITLALTPTFIENNRVRLAVEAERTFLRPPSSSVEFSYRLETSKTKINATVVMNFGETLILSGLSEKETGRTKSGVPGLSNIPGLEYLFSRKTKSEFQKTVLILLTPRKPQYTWPAPVAEDSAKRGSDLQELRERYGDWFKPYANASAIFGHLQDNALYREFRADDIKVEEWRDAKSFQREMEPYLKEIGA
jgi:general secretion pathway protein D